jgi:EH domain-containing protein 1
MEDGSYISSLRDELLGIVSDLLSPVALRYGYSEVPLETNIKWRPQVLLLGNYSSGKSTLINEFLGGTVQPTGQAPTDDSFTIITYDDSVPEEEGVRVTEERDGKYLLSSPEYPYEMLKKHGQRFAAHFQLKKVNSPFLKNLALIDTPGMLDSITERDRGYNYQDVIGDLAQIADLVLVLFDPHKAGTVREAHTSLRETLPARTFEDRVLFVLNRIDECASLNDLLRVYGTLCWNLSQITGRKDIPMIRLTYSPHASTRTDGDLNQESGYLSYLDNQREDLKRAILEAPRHRLDNLATFVETHSERLSHFLEALINYRKKLRHFQAKFFGVGFILSILVATIVTGGTMISGLLPSMSQTVYLSVGAGATLLLLFFWMTIAIKRFSARFNRKILDHIDDLTPLDTQTRKDSWESIRPLATTFLTKTTGQYSSWEVNRDYNSVHRVNTEGSKEIREVLNEMTSADARIPATPQNSATFYDDRDRAETD